MTVGRNAEREGEYEADGRLCASNDQRDGGGGSVWVSRLVASDQSVSARAAHPSIYDRHLVASLSSIWKIRARPQAQAFLCACCPLNAIGTPSTAVGAQQQHHASTTRPRHHVQSDSTAACMLSAGCRCINDTHGALSFGGSLT